MANYKISTPDQQHSDDLQLPGSITSVAYNADSDSFTVSRFGPGVPLLPSKEFPRADVEGLNTPQLKTAWDLILKHAIGLAGGTPE